MGLEIMWLLQTAFITGATVEPELPPPEKSAGVSTSHWVRVISTDILVLTYTHTHTRSSTQTTTLKAIYVPYTYTLICT